MTDDMFKFIDEQFKSTGVAYWACKACTQYAKMMNHKMREIEAELERVKESCQNNQGELKKVQNEVEKLAEKVSTQTKRVEEVAATAASAGSASVFEEIRERESKRTNVIIHGMGEAPPDQVGRARWDWDMKSCENLFKALHLPMGVEAIRFVRRVGEATGRPRPLVVGLHEERDKTRLLRADTRKTCFCDVDVVPDLTKAQRQEEEEMRAEMVRRNKQMPAEDREKNLAWMVVGPRGARRLVKKYINEEEERAAGRRARAGRDTAAHSQVQRTATPNQQPEMDVDATDETSGPTRTGTEPTGRNRLGSKRGRGGSAEAEEPPQTRAKH